MIRRLTHEIAISIVFVCIGMTIENESVWSCLIDSVEKANVFNLSVYGYLSEKVTTMVWSLVYYSIGILMYMILYAYEKNRTKKHVANSDFVSNLEGINANLIQLLHKR